MHIGHIIELIIIHKTYVEVMKFHISKITYRTAIENSWLYIRILKFSPLFYKLIKVDSTDSSYQVLDQNTTTARNSYHWMKVAFLLR